MRNLARIGIVALAALVAFFAVLALDLCWRIWSSRAGFDGAADVMLLLVLEAVRSAVTMAIVVIAIVALRRPEPGHAALSAALLFLALWYAKATTYAGFPGYMQQWLVLRLTEMRVSRDFLAFIFGNPAWAVAPFVAAFLGFSMKYPGPPDQRAVREMRATGRRGMMRGVAMAGIDVRSLVHRAAANVFGRGWFDNRVLALMGTGGAVVLAFGGSALQLAMLGVLAFMFAAAIAFLRTSCLTREGPHRGRLRFLGIAGISVCLEFLGSAALSFAPGAGAAGMALVLASAAPLCAIAFLTLFVTRTEAPQLVGS